MTSQKDAPITRNQARKGLGALRNRLHLCLAQQRYLTDQIVMFKEEKKFIPRKEAEAALKVEMQLESRQRTDIEEREVILYGDWRPKSPPSPEKQRKLLDSTRALPEEPFFE